MPSYGQSITVCYRAFDQSAHAGKTGDAGNHTLRLVADGASSAPTNAPSEVDSANAPGIYKLVLTTAECQYNLVYMCGKSSTANVTIEPQQVTFEMLPTATPGAIQGLWISDGSNNRLIDHASTVTTVTTVSGSVGSVSGSVNSVVNSVAATIAAGAISSPQSFNNTGQTTSYPVYAVPSTTGTQPDLDTPALYGRRLRLGINYPLVQTIAVANFDASSWTQIDFTVKTDPSIADSASTISIKVTNPSAGTDGLLLLNGAAPSGGTSASDGTITVNTATSSALSVTIILTARGAAIASGNYFAELTVYKASGKQSWLGSMKLDAQQTVRTNPTTS